MSRFGNMVAILRGLAMGVGFELALVALGISVGAVVGYISVLSLVVIGTEASLFLLASAIVAMCAALVMGVITELRQDVTGDRSVDGRDINGSHGE